MNTLITQPPTVQERLQVNREIIEALIMGKRSSLSKEYVYTHFTGKGGLHNLQQKDFPNYFEYSAAKKAIELGQFFTPPGLCEDIISILQPAPGSLVADIACGSGNFFHALPPHCKVYGNEIDVETCLVCEYLYPQVTMSRGSFVDFKPPYRFDLIFGNPPFNLTTDLGESQHAYVKKAFELLKFGGVLALIVPQSYLADDFQDQHKISWVNSRFNFIFQTKLPDRIFGADIATKLMIWQKKGVSNDFEAYSPKCFLPFDVEILRKEQIEPLYRQLRMDKAKLHLHTARHQESTDGYEVQFKKKLWHIKENPALRAKYYENVKEYINKLKSQVQPPDMSDEDWKKARLTPEKVLKYLTRILRDQNKPKPKEELKLVKTSYGLKYKAYHRKLESKSWYESNHTLLNKEVAPPFQRVFNRKTREYSNQIQPFDGMERDSHLDAILATYNFSPITPDGQLFELESPEIRLNTVQLHDLGLMLQKRYGLISWEQGSGKSIAGMAFLKYRQPQCRNIFLLAPALAVEGTWMKKLYVYGYDFIRIEKIADISKIRKGQVVLISMEILDSLARFIKTYIKRCGYKIGLLVDESDELTNPRSNRTLAALKCFRKGLYKLLMTGTSTRNTINELFAQLELLYNNSSNFLCLAPVSYHINKKGLMVGQPNPKIGRPFAAYSGYQDFKSCFCPHKTTVFGVKQELQDVYNEKLISDIIAYTIITRSFKEVVGEKKHTIQTLTVTQTEAERNLYSKLVKDFLQVVYDYYTSTGNARKESGLRLIRQIMVLIKASSVPHLMPNYSGTEAIGKYKAIKKKIKEWSSYRVTVGTTIREAAKDYYKRFQQDFPDRKLFYIDGQLKPKNRMKVLEEFKASSNGILCCTQGSLKSSINIPFCNRCIVESFQWNIPKLSQFYFRFIRFDNTEVTQVLLVNYENTIEINLLALLMAKEKLNQFVKSRELISTDDLYEHYDIDVSLLDSLITKQYDEDGKLYLRWGSQTFSQAA